MFNCFLLMWLTEIAHESCTCLNNASAVYRGGLLQSFSLTPRRLATARPALMRCIFERAAVSLGVGHCPRGVDADAVRNT